jgi:hypothetical protein
MRMPFDIRKILGIAYPALIGVAFLLVYINIFDAKLSLNGDNAAYYMLGKGIVSGYGYSSFNDVGHTPANHFPPGYPLIIAGIMLVFPDSILATKIMNGVFLGLALLLFFDIFRRIGVNIHLAFLSCIFLFLTTGATRVENEGLSINASLLTSSTITMSEVPFLFFVAVTLFAFLRLDERIRRGDAVPLTFSALRAPFRQPYFYLFLFGLTYTFHIRTAGISVFGFIMLYWLYYRRWHYAAATGAGYVLCALPWIIRGQSLGGSSYITELFSINPYRPELGQAGFFDFATRLVNNLQRYITKEIPVGSLPMTVSYDATTAGDWLFGLALLAVAVAGLLQLNRILLGSYFLCLFGVILLWPDVWTGARFLLPGVPFIIVCLVQGVHRILTRLFAAVRLPVTPHPLLLVVCIFFYIPNLRLVSAARYAPHPPEWQAYFELAKWAHDHTPPDAVIACRSPYLFAIYANRHTTFYANTLDDKALIQSLVDAKVTHVVLDQLGFSSTGRYLFPAIEKHMDRFAVAHKVKNPNNNYYQFLLEFTPPQAGPGQ